MHIFRFFFLKKHTYHGGVQKYLIRSGKVPEYTAIAGPRKNGREVTKQLFFQQEKIEKLLLQTQTENQERQLEFQKQILELTSLSSANENEFSFSQNDIWSAIQNFSYSPEEDVTFTSYSRRYEDLYTTDSAHWSDSKKVRLLMKLGTTEHTELINHIRRSCGITQGSLQIKGISFS